MDKESIYELQKIDCNCNDCAHMQRDLKRKPQKNAAVPINYGYCLLGNMKVSFIPAICQLDTQGCFTHRKDY